MRMLLQDMSIHDEERAEQKDVANDGSKNSRSAVVWNSAGRA